VGAVNVVSLCYSNQKSIAGGDEIMLRNLMDRGYFSAIAASFNMALNLAPFGRWTLRDKAAQRRLALR
jgi:hypothetical protein